MQSPGVVVHQTALYDLILTLVLLLVLLGVRRTPRYAGFLILLFGGLGVAVSPLFFILLLIVLILALSSGFYGRGRYW